MQSRKPATCRSSVSPLPARDKSVEVCPLGAPSFESACSPLRIAPTLAPGPWSRRAGECHLCTGRV